MSSFNHINISITSLRPVLPSSLFPESMRRVQDGLLLPLLLLDLWGCAGKTVGSQGSPGITLHTKVFLPSLSFWSPAACATSAAAIDLAFGCSPATALNHDTTSSVSAFSLFSWYYFAFS